MIQQTKYDSLFCLLWHGLALVSALCAASTMTAAPESFSPHDKTEMQLFSDTTSFFDASNSLRSQADVRKYAETFIGKGLNYEATVRKLAPCIFRQSQGSGRRTVLTLQQNKLLVSFQRLGIDDNSTLYRLSITVFFDNKSVVSDIVVSVNTELWQGESF